MINKVKVGNHSNFLVYKSFAEMLQGLKYAGQKVAFDFSSPNVAKTFHVGHLRSTFLGR